MSEQNEVLESKIELTIPGQLNDVSVARAVLEHMINELREKVDPPSRELSIAITNIQQAYLWLGEHVRLH